MLRNSIQSLKLKLIFFLSFFAIHFAFAQTSSLTTLPLVQTSDTTHTSAENNIFNTDLDKIKTIYQKLVNARGDFRYPVPSVFLRNEVSRVASIDYSTLEIVLEEKAYMTCQKFGDPAIAFLLGHELTHYYEKHAWRNGFAADYADLKVGKNLKSLQDQVANETQADYLGGFLAYSAGYGMFDKSGEIIRSLYKDYNLGELIPGYPSLNDRVELAKRTTKKLEALIDVYEMGNLLAAVGKYFEAYQYFNYILMQYQSREIYNNLGVTSVLEALQYFDKEKELIYKYPLELDLIMTGSRGNETIETRNNLLQTAIRHFDSSINLDPEYAPAYLNKATALALLGDTIRAKFYSEQEAQPIALRNKDFKTATDAMVLLGILKAKSGDKESAKKIFQNAMDQKNELARTNLMILSSGNQQKPLVKRSIQSILDSISGIDLKSFASNKPSFNNDRVINLNDDFTFFQYNIDSLNYKILFNRNGATKNRTYFLMTKANCKDRTSKNIGIGDDDSQVEKNYGIPNNIIETPNGRIYIYENVLFIIDQNKKVSQWASYFSKKSLI
jgi:tetratricopeptide (TPR) repeat protein